MACGKPFISTDTGCVIEMPGGAIVTSREEMTGMMEKLLADPQLRVEYGKRGRDEYLRKYRREMILDAYEAVLRNKLQAS
jgi:glycosyltransferase involved in cell wall biosynthesis